MSEMDKTVKTLTEVEPAMRKLANRVAELLKVADACAAAAKTLDRINMLRANNKVKGVKAEIVVATGPRGGSGGTISVVLSKKLQEMILDEVVKEYKQTTLRVYDELEKFTGEVNGE